MVGGTSGSTQKGSSLVQDDLDRDITHEAGHPSFGKKTLEEGTLT